MDRIPRYIRTYLYLYVYTSDVQQIKTGLTNYWSSFELCYLTLRICTELGVSPYLDLFT